MSRYDVRGTGFNPHSTGPKENVRKKWTFEVGNNSITAPVVSQNTVYVGEDGGAFYAINATDGDKKWEFDPSGGLDHHSDPVIHSGRVYVRSKSDILYALDTEQGNQLWKSNIGVGSPLPIEDTLYIAGDILAGLDAQNGTQKWHRSTIETNDTAVIANDRIVSVGLMGMRAYNISGGQEIWSNPTYSFEDLSSLTRPTIENEIVYFGASKGLDEYVFALDANTGTEIWSEYFGGNELGTLASGFAVAEGTVFGAGESGHAFSLSGDSVSTSNRPSLQSGNWDTELSEKEFSPIYSPPSSTTDTVYFVTGEVVHAIDLSNGEWRWTFETKNAYGSLAVVDDHVFFGSHDGKVHALKGN